MATRDPNRVLANERRAVAEAFELGATPTIVEPLGAGHIHETLLSRTRGPKGHRAFVHQRLNQTIFPDPDALMGNLARVTQHLQRQLRKRRVPDLERRTLTLIPTRSGDFLYRDEQGSAWRTLLYIEDSMSLEVARRPREIFEAARAFARFAVALSDLPGPRLHETIPHFHDFAWRRDEFHRALQSDAAGRRDRCPAEIARAHALYEEVVEASRAVAAEQVPRRLCHNDCKLNNVLLDRESGEALCVIDLDTVMEWSLLCDFGELIRTSSCPFPEDAPEADLTLDPQLLQAACQGYTNGSGELLTAAELEALPVAGPRMALENAMRFLGDYVAGDPYFRVQREHQNLERARTQMRICELLLEAAEPTRRFLEESANFNG